jgi:hypothetical protein
MKTFVAMVVALATTTSVAFAGEPAKPSKPTKLTEAQMDRVTAGALIFVNVQNVLNHNDVDVTVPVTVKDINANVVAAVAVLGTAGAVGGIAD